MLITINNFQIQAEVAQSIFAHAIGLMGRKHLAERHGMLFVFRRDVREVFWTFGMRFSIDIIFIDASKTITEIREDCRPWRSVIYPKKKFRYAIEVAAGSARRMNVHVGDAADF